MLLLTSSLLSYPLNRMAFGMQGEINIKGGHIRMPFSPPEIPLFQQHNNKMAYVYVTDYLLNSGFMAAFKNQQLSGYVNESLVSIGEATRFCAFFLICFHHCFLSNVHRLLFLVNHSSPPASCLCVVHCLLLFVYRSSLPDSAFCSSCCSFISSF